MLSLLSSISAVLVVAFCSYVASIMIPFLRRRPEPPGDGSTFDWHFFVPCRDEESVIKQTIHSTRTRFPNAHVWIIDDDSEDATAAIVSRAAKTDPYVHLVQRRRPLARTGKGDALNSAYAALQQTLDDNADRSKIIVCVIDADGELASNALDAVATPRIFGDRRVGAAQVTVWMKNRNVTWPLPGRSRVRNYVARWLIRMQDMEFRTMIVGMQALRERTGTVGLGGNGQFTRLSVLDTIAEEHGCPWHGSLLEDYELGVHVLLAGYENRHVFDTHVAQEALVSMRRFVTQRTRWAQGNIQCARYLPAIFRSPNFDTTGVLESSYYLVLPFLQLLGILTWLALAGFGVANLIASEGRVDFSNPTTSLWAPAALFLLFGIGPFAVWGPLYVRRCEPSKSMGRGLLYGVGMWLYVFYTYATTTRAFARVVLRRRGWAKTRRNAETHSIGAVALEK